MMNTLPHKSNSQSPAALSLLLLLFFLCSISESCKTKKAAPDNDISKIGHVVVLYLENHSFDNLFGEFQGANGFASAKGKQIDSSGNAYTYLPPIPFASSFPANLPNQPFNIDQFVPSNKGIPDLVHRFYQEQQQIDGGKMDKFVLVSNAKALTMGFYKTSGLPLAKEAAKYTLCDNMFHSAFGGSFLNHIWFIAAASPVFPNPPSNIIAQLDASGNLLQDGIVTPDGWAVNTCFSVNHPHPDIADPRQLLPNQTLPTIGDRLTEKKVDWAWYAGGWNDALSGKANPSFQYHHQPFIYFKNYADGQEARTKHLKDESDFLTAAKNGTLPPVSFVKPIGYNNEHPGYADVTTGENHTMELINAVRNGPNWKDAVIIITYDENGGFWDHVAPPVVDKWGPGTRVPTIIISPFVKTGYIDHTEYETLSILKLIEMRWNLKPLNNRDAQTQYFQDALNLK